MDTILEPSEKSNFLSRVACPSNTREGTVDLVYVMGKANTEVLKVIDRTIQSVDSRITRANDFENKANFDCSGYIENSIPAQNHHLRYHYNGMVGKNAALKIIEKLSKSKLISQEDKDTIYEFRQYGQANIRTQRYMLRRNSKHLGDDSIKR